MKKTKQELAAICRQKLIYQQLYLYNYFKDLIEILKSALTNQYSLTNGRGEGVGVR